MFLSSLTAHKKCLLLGSNRSTREQPQPVREKSPRTNLFVDETGGSNRAEFKMKAISEETCMNAANNGFRNPKAARPTPMLSTTRVPTKFCIIVRRHRLAIKRVSTSLERSLPMSTTLALSRVRKELFAGVLDRDVQRLGKTVPWQQTDGCRPRFGR